MPGGGGGVDEEQPIKFRLDVPGTDRLFQIESEASLFERMRQEARDRPNPERLVFPEEPIVTRERYAGRHWPVLQEIVEPNYVCYQRLYFEEKNSERYGWELGILQPFLSAAVFYADVITLPYHAGTEPCRKFECSAGQCLPGDPVPYLLYPPQFSLTGLAAEAGAVVALVFIFPG